MTARDNQRQRLYDAEDLLPCRNARDLPTVPEMQRFIDGVLGRRWFQSRWGRRSIEVRDGRGHRRATSYGAVLHMPLWSRSRLVLLHELAHSLTPNRYASHGPEYAGIFLTLVRNEMGKETGDALKGAFKAKRVRYNMTAVPKAGSNTVVTKAAVAAKERAAKNRPLLSSEVRGSAEGVRRGIRAGIFGPSGSALRKSALAVAKRLESM